MPAEGFLPALSAWCASAGALYVADEIQTGFCRTGAWFASEHEGVVPDLVATAKGIAAGLPLAGVTGPREVMDAVHEGGLGGTYGGNPVACAAALATIGIMHRDDLCARARWIESVVRPRLEALAAATPGIGEVRGRGAMLAVEFVQPGTTTPNPAAVKSVLAACHAEGVVAISCGTFGNVVRLLPPLSIEGPLLDDGLSVLESAIAALDPAAEGRTGALGGAAAPRPRLTRLPRAAAGSSRRTAAAPRRSSGPRRAPRPSPGALRARR